MSRRAQLETLIKEAMGMGNLGAEEVARVQLQVQCRARDKLKLDADFATAQASRRGDRALLEKLFVQTPAAAAENGSPMLSKISSDESTVMAALKKKSFDKSKSLGHSGMVKLSTPNIDAYFAKLAEKDTRTEAQKRYPELLKASSAYTTSVARAAPAKKPAGAIPSRSILSGGQA